MFRSCAAVGSVLLGLASSGCTIPVFTKPVTVSTKAIPGMTDHGDAKLVKGKSCSRMTLLIIPLGFGTSDSAFEDALSQAPGTDTLVDWHMTQDVLSIIGTVIYFQSCVTVEGYPVNASKLVRQARDPDAARRYVSYWQGRREDAHTGKPPEQAITEVAKRSD
jgi:hypothetical protein